LSRTPLNGLRTDCVRRVTRWATRMGGLPFDSVRPNRSLQSDLKTPETASSPSIPALHRLPVTYARPYDQRNPAKTEPRETNPFFGRLPIHLQNQCPRRMRFFQSDWKVGPTPSGPELRKLEFLLQCGGRMRNFGRASSALTSPLRNAAQPLHHGLSEGWDDCSQSHGPAGRVNEETAK
jgi:hypothetical protein